MTTEPPKQHLSQLHVCSAAHAVAFWSSGFPDGRNISAHMFAPGPAIVIISSQPKRKHVGKVCKQSKLVIKVFSGSFIKLGIPTTEEAMNFWLDEKVKRKYQTFIKRQCVLTSHPWILKAVDGLLADNLTVS